MAMLRFLIRRILTGILVLWVVATGTFFLFFTAVPEVAVARNLAGRAATPQVIAEVTRYYGLDKPISVQYWHFLTGLLQGNLGKSYFLQEPVTTVIKQDLPPTISVVIGGVLLWLIVGLSVGILSATRARSFFDRVATVGVLAGISAPTFVVGELLIIFVFVQLNDHGIGFIQTGYTRHHLGSRRLAGLHDPALDHPGHRPGRRLHPAVPRLAARHAGRGLHQDRAVQGHLRAARALPARGPLGDDPGRLPARHRHRRPARRRARGRAGLRPRRASARRRSPRSPRATSRW